MNGKAGWSEPGPAELDEATSDSLIDGRISPADAPHGYKDVAQLVAVIRHGVEPEAASSESPTVAAVVDQISGRRPTPAVEYAPRRRRGKKRAAAVAALLGAVLSAGTAAAATGNMPAAIQAAAHDVAADFGISIPGPALSAGRQAAVPGSTCAQNPQVRIPATEAGFATPDWSCAMTVWPTESGAGSPSTDLYGAGARRLSSDRRHVARPHRASPTGGVALIPIAGRTASHFSGSPESSARRSGGALLLEPGPASSRHRTLNGRATGSQTSSSANPPPAVQSRGPQLGHTRSAPGPRRPPQLEHPISGGNGAGGSGKHDGPRRSSPRSTKSKSHPAAPAPMTRGPIPSRSPTASHKILSGPTGRVGLDYANITALRRIAPSNAAQLRTLSAAKVSKSTRDERHGRSSISRHEAYAADGQLDR